MPEATWNGKAWVTDDGTVVSTDPNAGTPVASHTPESNPEDILPALMGTGASIAAGSKAWPGGMAAAGAGGAAGEMLRQGILRARKGVEPTTSDVVLRGVKAALGPVGMLAGEPEAAAAGVAQMGLEGAGRMGGAIATTAGKELYKQALAPAMHLAREYGMDKMVNAGFANKVWPNKLGKPKAGRLLGQAADEVTGIADAASQGIAPQRNSVYQAATVEVPNLMRKAQQQANVAGATNAVPEILDRANQVLQANPGQMTQRELLDARRVSDAVSEKAWDQVRASGGRENVSTEGSFAKAMGQGYNKLLRENLGEPFLQANQKAQTLYGLKKAVQDASLRPHKLANQMTVVGATAGGMYGQSWEDAAKGAVIGRTLMSPTFQAGVAFSLPPAAKHLVRSAPDVATQGGATGSLRDELLKLMEGNTEIP